MAVNKMVVYGYSAADIHAEIGKCEVLCANCHRREHHGPGRTVEKEDRNGSAGQDSITGQSKAKRERLQAWTHQYQRDRGCRRCDEDDPTCLQIHHPDGAEKTKGIGAMISDSDPEEVVRTEVQQCTVLCVNCHRKEHN